MKWPASTDLLIDAENGAYGVDVISNTEPHFGQWIRLHCEKDCRFHEIKSNWDGFLGMRAGEEANGKFEEIWLDRGEVWAYKCKEAY